MDVSFPVIPIPRPGDWLTSCYEPGQTVDDFRRLKKLQPSRTYDDDCLAYMKWSQWELLSLGPTLSVSSHWVVSTVHGQYQLERARSHQYLFTSLCSSPDLNVLCEFSKIFFPGCEIQVAPAVNFDKQIKKRIHPATDQPQYLVSNLIASLKQLQRKRKNRHELLCVGVTMADIYPSPDWNFVYGSAAIEDGIGIYSFARFDPLFPESLSAKKNVPLTDSERVLILRRAVSTYLHEVMHLFGLEHCIYYLCLMNGANCESEMDGQPIYLCPVCLRKMHCSFHKQNFHVINMYEDLMNLARKTGFNLEADWYKERLALLNNWLVMTAINLGSTNNPESNS